MSLLDITTTTPEPPAGRPDLDLRLASLLVALPPLTGVDPETVAIAMVLRMQALGEVLVRVLAVYDRNRTQDGPEDLAAADRHVLGVWREHVALIVERTDANWWLVNGRRGSASVTHPPVRRGKRRLR